MVAHTQAQGRTLVEIFKPYVVPATVGSALDYLREHSAGVRLLALYKHYFSEEYAASKASRKLGKKQAFSDMEIEFLRLVNDNLFPLNDYQIGYIVEEWADEYEHVNEHPDPRDFEIPTEPLGLQDWEEANRAYYRPGWQLLMECIAEDGWSSYDPDGGLPEDLKEAAKEIGLWDATPLGGPRFDEAKMSQVLSKVPHKHEPLRQLPGALRMLARNTGLIYLDAYIDQTIGPWISANWTRNDMDWLIDECKQARSYMAEVDKLLDWMEQDKANMWRVLGVLQNCVEDQEKPARGRTRVAVRA